MFALEFPEDVARIMIGPQWNLGTLCLTRGVADLIDMLGNKPHLDNSLMRHLAGDYGLISQDSMDHQKTHAARARGLFFKSIYDWERHVIYVATDPIRKITVVCLAAED